MNNPPKSKLSILFVCQFAIAAVTYGLVMWLLDSIFESDHKSSFVSIAIQSVVFGLLFTLYTVWSVRRKNSKNKE